MRETEGSADGREGGEGGDGDGGVEAGFEGIFDTKVEGRVEHETVVSVDRGGDAVGGRVGHSDAGQQSCALVLPCERTSPSLGLLRKNTRCINKTQSKN